MSINRQFTGPTINVCLGDSIHVDVTNLMSETGAALHWHGFLQRNTQYSDGVPFITQCPIQFNSKFRYSFVADKAGTFFYRGHDGNHEANGQYGAIVVRENKRNDPNARLYDQDLVNHVIVISDWATDYDEW